MRKKLQGKAAQHEVEVRIHNLGENGEGNEGKGHLSIQGIMLFADVYPDPPTVVPLAMAAPEQPEFTAEELYSERLMFHGPRFQGVASLDQLADEGVVGQLMTLPFRDRLEAFFAAAVVRQR